MNKKQKIVLWVGVIIIILMGLFPPMRCFDDEPYYAFILDDFVCHIDYPKLLLQWFLVAMPFAVFFLLKRKS